MNPRRVASARILLSIIHDTVSEPFRNDEDESEIAAVATRII